MVGLPWHKRDHTDRYEETRRVSLIARGMLTDLVDTMYRTGKPLAYDVAYLCHVCAVRDKRQIEKPLQELMSAGLIILADGMLSNPAAMAGIEEANRHISNGKKGGRPTKKVGEKKAERPITAPSVPDRFPITDGSQVVDIEQKQSLRQNPIDQDKKREPTGSARAPQNGGGGPVDLVIREYYRIIADIWSEQEMLSSRSGSSTNPTHAGQWLEKAGGDFRTVSDAMRLALQDRYDRTPGDIPGSLAASKTSVPMKIAKLDEPCNLTSGSRAPVGSTKSGEKPLWMMVRETAFLNNHMDIVAELGALSKTDTEAANRRAREVQEFVAQKKAEAA